MADGAPSEVANGEDEEIRSGSKVVITEADNGETVDLVAGQDFTIELASNPTTGFKWSVAVVDRTLGQPASERFVGQTNGPIGSGGKQIFQWKTTSPLDVSGKHEIELRLARSFEHAPPAKTFHVTVSIAKATDAAAAIQGKWGADGATMTVSRGKAQLQFGCAHASIDAFAFNGSAFTATGTRTQETGVRPPPGMGPRPEPATFSGRIAGNKLSLDMKVGGDTSKLTFTKDRQVNLIHCL